MAADTHQTHSESPIELGEQLGMVVELMSEVAAAQSRQAAVLRMVVGVAGNLVTAYDALQESVAELQARVGPLAGGGAETGAGLAAEVDEQADSPLHAQARQLQQHADELKRHAVELMSKSQSLTKSASGLMGDGDRIEVPSGPTRTHVTRDPPGGDPPTA